MINAYIGSSFNAVKLLFIKIPVYFVYIEYRKLSIKTHGSELQGQKEAEFMHVFRPTQPLPWNKNGSS